MVEPIYVYLTKIEYFLDEQHLFRFKRCFFRIKGQIDENQ